MLIDVYHDADHVATVNAPHNNVEDALEYAFRWTQNIEGSWSMGIGADRNRCVHVIAPLQVVNGRVYGLRSSMVGDTFVTENGDRYRCAAFGFKREVA